MKKPQIIECVPNFSEGRNLHIINEIEGAIRNTPNVYLLHTDVGYDANRTVITFAGEAPSVYKAAYKAIEKASELIDMKKHEGAHPRIGATDVCPLIPIANINLQETAELAKRLAKRVGCILNIPCYCYGDAALSANKKNLEDCRRGEYEGIVDKITLPEWKVDYGPNAFNTRSGISVIGARKILIAYNVSLNTSSVATARKIAGIIRESGTKQEPKGLLKDVKAIGWSMPEYNVTQVSTNLTNYEATGMHTVFETIKTAANQLGVDVLGSELIGLVPKNALLDAGRYYSDDCNNEAELIQLAVRKLGLEYHQAFNPNNRIIEYKMPL